MAVEKIVGLINFAKRVLQVQEVSFSEEELDKILQHDVEFPDPTMFMVLSQAGEDFWYQMLKTSDRFVWIDREKHGDDHFYPILIRKNSYPDPSLS